MPFAVSEAPRMSIAAGCGRSSFGHQVSIGDNALPEGEICCGSTHSSGKIQILSGGRLTSITSPMP